MLDLVPLYRATYQLAPFRLLQNTPLGTRILIDVTTGRVEGDRIQASVAELSGDWVTVSPAGIGLLDVRVTMETDDGASILVTYNGRMVLDESLRPGPLVVAPTFSTGDERYAFLNAVQAVGRGDLSDDLTTLTYDIYEVRA